MLFSQRLLFPNTYTATLTVTDDDGGVGSDTLQVTVTAPPTPCTVPELTALLADLHAQGQIEDETYEDLQERLEKAQRELDRGRSDKAARKLWDFVEKVNKETGEEVTPEAAAALKDSAFCVLGTLDVDEDALRGIEQLRAQVEDDYAQGLIDKESVRDKLLKRLEKAQEQIVKVKPDKAVKELDKFIETVEEERGEHIDPAAADELVEQAQALADGLHDGDDDDDGDEDGAEHDGGDNEGNDDHDDDDDGDDDDDDD